MPANVLVLDGNPDPTSLCSAMCDAAAEGARHSGATVQVRRISAMSFDPNLPTGYKTNRSLEPDLQALWDDLIWCDHLILVHPLWWGSAPAKLKGAFDRILRPGIAFAYAEGKALPDGLLAPRKVDVLITSDTPSWYLRLVYKSGWHHILRKQILEFCGFKVGRIRNVATIRNSDPSQRIRFLDQARKLGQASAA